MPGLPLNLSEDTDSSREDQEGHATYPRSRTGLKNHKAKKALFLVPASTARSPSTQLEGAFDRTTGNPQPGSGSARGQP